MISQRNKTSESQFETKRVSDKCGKDKIICVEMNVNSFRLNFWREREMWISWVRIFFFSRSFIRKIHTDTFQAPASTQPPLFSMNHWIKYTRLITKRRPWIFLLRFIFNCILYNFVYFSVILFFSEFWISQSNNFYFSNRKNNSESCASVRIVKQTQTTTNEFVYLFIYCYWCSAKRKIYFEK